MRALAWSLPALAWIGLIAWFSTKSWGGDETGELVEQILRVVWPSLLERLSASQLETINFLVRKAAHFVEYAVLASLIVLAVVRGFGRSIGKALIVGFLLAIAVATADEIHQVLVPNRTGNPLDIVLDATGAAFACVLIRSRSTRRAVAR